MDKKNNLIFESFHHSGKKPLWWFLGFLQVNSLLAIVWIAKNLLALNLLKFAFFLLFFLFNFVTYILWLEVYKISLPEKERFKVGFLSQVFVRLCVISAIGFFVSFLFKILVLPVVFKFILLSFLDVFLVLAMLFVAIKNLNIFQAVFLTMDFLRKKTWIFLSLFFGQVLLQTWWFFSKFLKLGFSDGLVSAIILSVLVVIEILVAFLTAVLNCWLVLFFLAQTDSGIKYEAPEILESSEAVAI